MKLLPIVSCMALAFYTAASSPGKIIKSSDGTDIFATSAGNPHNPSLVFAHGLGLNALVFDELFADKQLVDNFYLVAYDLRGHGRSGKPNTTDAYASKLFADDFTAVARTFMLKSPILVGWSYGGTVASDIDILSFLPPGTISGIVGTATVLVNGLPDKLSNSTLNFIGGFLQQMTWHSTINTKVTFIDNCFNDASIVPAEIKWAWLGSAGIQLPPATLCSLSPVVRRTPRLYSPRARRVCRCS